jgi:cytochrome P450
MSVHTGTGNEPATSDGVPVVDGDPWDLSVLADPLPLQREVRERAPVVFLRSHGVYATGRFDLVRSSLVDWQRFESRAGVGLMDKRHERPWRPPSLLLEADPPRHDAPRSVLSSVLSPRALRRLRDAWATVADDLVDGVLGQARTRVHIDAVPALAKAFPLAVFPRAVGLPAGGHEHLLRYGDHSFNTFGPPNELTERGERTIAEHAAWVNEQCERDMLSRSGFGADVWAAVDREEITAAQAPLIVRSLLSAGLDTTVHAIGALLHGFATHPSEWQRLRDGRATARTAFDEAVRWQSPVQTFTRTATRDVELEGSWVPKGSKILLMLAAANRDPRRWAEPDRFDLTRDPSGHVGFGMGLHHCVGQHVARLEATLLLSSLMRRVERIELAGEPRRHLNNTLRAWASLPLTLYLA